MENKKQPMPSLRPAPTPSAPIIPNAPRVSQGANTNTKKMHDIKSAPAVQSLIDAQNVSAAQVNQVSQSNQSSINNPNVPTPPPMVPQSVQSAPNSMPAPTPRQASRDSFVKELLKRGIRIVFTWNVVVVCLIATFAVIGFASALLAGASAGSAMGPSYGYIYGNGTNEFLSLKVKGVIVGSNDSDSSFSGLFSGESLTYGYDIKDKLYAAADDDLIKGVILEIDSPGGTIYGAHAIADGVEYYREKTNKPIYAHIEGTGASGAYWAAASTDKIFADYGSDTGSIGVIMGPFQYYDKVLETNNGLLGGGVVTQNGIQSVTLTAGRSKDIGNPYRKLTDAEVVSLQKTVDNEYDGFVAYVSSRRSIPDAIIRNQIGAMVYDSKSAKELKLVDAVGSRQDAYDALADSVKLKNDYTIVREQVEPGLVGSLIGAITRNNQPKASFDLCKLSQSSMAYHGDVSSWCSKQD